MDVFVENHRLCHIHDSSTAWVPAMPTRLQVGDSSIVCIVCLVVHDELIIDEVEAVGAGLVRGIDHLLN